MVNGTFLLWISNLSIFLLITFGSELIGFFSNGFVFAETEMILLSLYRFIYRKLLLIVIFSGYENFVSKIDIGDHVDKPSWMGTVDFSGLKLKLISSIVAISGIHLLKLFFDISKYTKEEIYTFIAVHLTFVISGLILACMDFVVAKTKQKTNKK